MGPSRKIARGLIVGLALLSVALLGHRCRGLNPRAMFELWAAGGTKYLGRFTPASSEDVGEGWTKYTFDSDGGDGPVCIAGTDYSVFTKAGDPEKLLIFLQGGGACWQDFYFCNILAEDQEPPPPPAGIWDSGNPDNPFADYSIVYLPYCDGSVHIGDNDVVDPSFPFAPDGIRRHRGLRNQSAGITLAKATFPHPHKITVAGSSAGGVGVAGLTPFLVRFAFGNFVDLTVFNDAGPVAINLDESDAIAARAADWQFGQFYPASCTACDDEGQATAIIDWRLANDASVREAFYETDADGTNRFFLNVPTQAQYRDILLTEHGALHDAYPYRYRRFIVSGDTSHTALQGPLFYSQEIDGVRLNEWTQGFLTRSDPWYDLVEDLVPLP